MLNEMNEQKKVTLTLSQIDIELIIRALDKLPTADLGVDLVTDLLTEVLLPQKKDPSFEEQEKQSRKEAERTSKRLLKEQEMEELKKKTELVKARLTIALDGE